MILPTGNSLAFFKRNLIKRQGFSFIEVLISIAILYFGIVFIFRTFFISLDSLTYLNHRFYATIQLENRLAVMQRRLDMRKGLPLEEQRDTKIINLGDRTLTFEHLILAKSLNKQKDLYEMDCSVSWKEGNHDRKISRSAYLLAYSDSK